MSKLINFTNVNTPEAQALTKEWNEFLLHNNFDASFVREIDMSQASPIIFDHEGNKFSINFVDNKQNYHKQKASIKSELISKALGTGRYGLNILDLSAGLGIDSVFLAQLGYSVTALERNPLIYLALNEAAKLAADAGLNLSLKFEFAEALAYLQNNKITADVIYFDPMFPQKEKSALPRQEMVFFKNLVGQDADAEEVLAAALSVKGIKRVVVKRPLKAPALLKPHSSTEGKLIRFDIYGVHS
ncbi:MAG: class I SAM-dependent methyltransferase [Pseudobdellovibrio sp.]